MKLFAGPSGDENEHDYNATIEYYNNQIAALQAEIWSWEAEKTRLSNQINTLNTLIPQQNDKITAYNQQASFWADAVSRCNTREAEIRQSMAGIEDEIRGAGWPDSADIQLYQLKAEMETLAQNAEIARRVYEFALDVSSGKAVREEIYDAYAEAERAMAESDAAYKESVVSLKELADKMNEGENLDQETYLALSNEYNRKAAESKELYEQYAEAVLNFKVQDREREYLLSPRGTPDEALDVLNEAEKALAEATEKYENALSLAKQDELDQMTGEDSNIVQASLYLNKVSEGRLSDASKSQIQKMLRQITELESIGDSVYNLGRTLNRHRLHCQEAFTAEQTQHMLTMMQLVDGALAEMMKQIDQPLNKKVVKTSINIEHEINNYRTQLKNQNLHDVNSGVYDYQLGVFYVDFISECEKLGDYVMNVVQAGQKRNNDLEDMPYNEQN